MRDLRQNIGREKNICGGWSTIVFIPGYAGRRAVKQNRSKNCTFECYLAPALTDMYPALIYICTSVTYSLTFNFTFKNKLAK